MALYHRAEHGLGPGTIIRPGRWFRTVLAMRGHKCAFHAQLVEAVRLAEFRERPSHAESTFAFLDRDSANAFRSGDVTYQVEVRQADLARSFRADMGWDDYLHDASLPLEQHIAFARAYWRGEKTNDPRLELVIPGPLHVVRAL